MTEVRFRAVQPGDVEALLSGLRIADAAEIVASTDLDLKAAIETSIEHSDVCVACEIDGQLACLFGVVLILSFPRVGSPWLLGTVVLDEHPRALVRHSRVYIREMIGSFYQLINYVDARNSRSIRWLRALGFTIRPAEPYGPWGLPFHRFDMGF